MSLPPSADCTCAVLRQFEPRCHHWTPERRSSAYHRRMRMPRGCNAYRRPISLRTRKRFHAQPHRDVVGFVPTYFVYLVIRSSKRFVTVWKVYFPLTFITLALIGRLYFN